MSLRGEQFCDLIYHFYLQRVERIRKFPEGINTDKHWKASQVFRQMGMFFILRAIVLEVRWFGYLPRLQIS